MRCSLGYNLKIKMNKIWRGHFNLQDLYSMLFDHLFMIKEQDIPPARREPLWGESPFSGVPPNLQAIHNMIYYIVVNSDKFDWEIVELAKKALTHLTKLSLITCTMAMNMDEISDFNTVFCQKSRRAMLELNNVETMAFYADKITLSFLIDAIRSKLC